MSDRQIWFDDTRRAAVTLAMAAQCRNDSELADADASIDDALESGRPHEYVLELLRLLTNGLGEAFNNDQTAAAFRVLAAQCQAHEDELRAQGEWRIES